MKYLLLLFFAFGVFGGVLGQDNDRVLDSLRRVYDNEKIMHKEIYNRIAYEIAIDGRIQESINMLNEVIIEIKNTNSLEELSSCYKTLGQIHSLYIDDYNKALKYYKKSLQIANQMEEGTDKKLIQAVIYTTSSRSLEALGNIDSSFVLLNKALHLRKKYGKDKRKELQIHSFLIANIAQRAKYKEALDYATAVVSDYAHVDTLSIVSILLVKRVLYADLGQYDSSIITLEKAERLLDLYTTTDPILIRAKQHNLVNIAMQRGALMGKMDKHQEALNHFRHALKLSIQYKKTLTVLAVMYENIATANFSLGNMSSAIDTAKLALNNYKVMGFEEHIATQTGFIGVLYDSLGKYDSAVVYIKESVQLLEKMNYPEKLLTSLQNLSSCYVDIGNKEALNYALKAEQKAKEIGTDRGLWKTYYILAQAYETTGNAIKALESYQMYIHYRDKDFSLQQKQKVDSLRTIYQVNEKEQQIKEEELKNQLTKKQLQNSKIRNWVIGITLSSLLIILATIFLLFRQRAKRKQTELELKSQKEEKEREKIASQLKEIQFNVENQLNTEHEATLEKSYSQMSSLVHNVSGGALHTIILQLKTLKTEDKETKNELIGQLEVLKEKYRQVTQLFEILSKESLEDQLQKFFRILESNYPFIFFSYEVLELPQLTTDITGEKAQDIFTCIQEAIFNAIKHASPSTINIIVSSTEENDFKVEIKDDGEGFDITKNAGGAGLRVCREKAKDLGGIFDVKSLKGEGTITVLLIPEQNSNDSLEDESSQNPK